MPRKPYKGPERRSGKDRRSGLDRRKEQGKPVRAEHTRVVGQRLGSKYDWLPFKISASDERSGRERRSGKDRRKS